MVNIVLFGAPGCGKGTQAQRLKEHYGIDHVSTGEVIRDEIRRGTELGQSMEAYIKAGQLAPDEIVIGMIDHYVTGHMNAAGCIFDGFPRTTAVTDTGAVSSSWSVLVWRSSAMERMVRMGTTTMKMKREEPREREK